MYAQFKTWYPYVLDLNVDFSLSHLYLWWNNPILSKPFVEVGYYRGTGYPQGQNVTNGAEYYDAWLSSASGYQERDKNIFPAYGSWNSYEIVFDSFSGGHYYYDVLINGLRYEQIINDDLGSTAQGLAGGETTPHVGNEITVSAQPQELLQSPTQPWTEWTPALMNQVGDSTVTCTDSSVAWTYTVQFDNYTVDGYVTQ